MKNAPHFKYSYYAVGVLALALCIPTLTSAAIIQQPAKTSDEIQARYAAYPQTHKKVSVLLVPGHEPDFGGTEFNGLKERDIVLDLTNRIATLLNAKAPYRVTVSRNDDEWDERIEKTFALDKKDIQKFVSLHKKNLSRLIGKGGFELVSGVAHNAAPEKAALHLYGVNRWANARDIDLAVHVHFNDYVRSDVSIPGEHTGFGIYVPESQFKNAEPSHELAESVAAQLVSVISTSTLPLESVGIVEDQELIAIGAFNTARYPSILIEYGYIYEAYLHDEETRNEMFDKLARETVEGIEAYLKNE